MFICQEESNFNYTYAEQIGFASENAYMTGNVDNLTDTLTISDLFYQDIDDGDAEVTFSASSFINGGLLLSGVSVTSFTGAELSAGDVAPFRQSVLQLRFKRFGERNSQYPLFCLPAQIRAACETSF